MDYILSKVLSQQLPPIHKNSKLLVAVLLSGYVERMLSRVRSIFDTTIQIQVFFAVLVLIFSKDPPGFFHRRFFGLS